MNNRDGCIDQMTVSLFSDQELSTLGLHSQSVKDRKIRARVDEVLSGSFYTELSLEQKLVWLNNQASGLESKAKSNKSVFFIFLGVLVLMGLGIGGIFGSLIVAASGAVLLLTLFSGQPRETLLRPYLSGEIRRISVQRSQEIAQEQADLKSEMQRKIAEASTKSEHIFLQMKKNPSSILKVFQDYKEYVSLEIQSVSPGQEHINSNVVAKELANQILIRSVGVWVDGYVPANDQKFSNLLELLNREKQRIKELASFARLPFVVIEYYQEISRNYYGLHREGGNATIYDEQLITNEVMAMKDSLVVHGDYTDRSMHLDKSVTHNNHVSTAIVDDGKYDNNRIKKEILKIIISAEGEASSRAELMAGIPVKESRLLAVLEHLQNSGMLKISNRPSGEIIYKLDRLAG